MALKILAPWSSAARAGGCSVSRGCASRDLQRLGPGAGRGSRKAAEARRSPASLTAPAGAPGRLIKALGDGSLASSSPARMQSTRLLNNSR